MSAFLAHIGRSLTQHWKRGLIGLIAVIVIVGAIVGSQGKTVAQDFAIPGTESQKALDLLEAKLPAAAGVTSQIVYTTQDGKLTDAGKKAAIESSLTNVKKLKNVIGASDPLAKGSISQNGRTASNPRARPSTTLVCTTTLTAIWVAPRISACTVGGAWPLWMKPGSRVT